MHQKIQAMSVGVALDEMKTIDMRARELGLTRSNLVRQALRDFGVALPAVTRPCTRFTINHDRSTKNKTPEKQPCPA